MIDLYNAARGYGEPGRNAPVVHIEVPQSALSQLKNLKAGNEVHVLLIGKLDSKTERKPDLDTPGYVASVTVEVRRFAICRDENSMADLMDE